MNYKERQEIIAKSPISFAYLKRFNIVAGILHFVQGIVMVALGLYKAYNLDIYTFYLKFNIISTNPFNIQIGPDPKILLTIGYIGVAAALFPLMSAAAHFTIAFVKNKSYNDNLKKGMNPYRWYEYAFSSSLMIFLIASFSGVWEMWSLVMIFVLNAMMIMFGYLMEKINQYTERTDWSPFVLGCISGGTPWLAIYAYFIAAITSVSQNVPTFVYLIVSIYFILFMIFAVNMVLQYKGVGRWNDYLYGERMYIVLSLVAKTLLAWLVFSGIFMPR
jgi:sulfite exporter TauE/SafE